MHTHNVYHASNVLVGSVVLKEWCYLFAGCNTYKYSSCDMTSTATVTTGKTAEGFERKVVKHTEIHWTASNTLSVVAAASVCFSFILSIMLMSSTGTIFIYTFSSKLGCRRSDVPLQTQYDIRYVLAHTLPPSGHSISSSWLLKSTVTSCGATVCTSACIVQVSRELNTLLTFSS